MMTDSPLLLLLLLKKKFARVAVLDVPFLDVGM
jgi:hypothetical protein